jgi:hypothetical protein
VLRAQHSLACSYAAVLHIERGLQLHVQLESETFGMLLLPGLHGRPLFMLLREAPC